MTRCLLQGFLAHVVVTVGDHSKNFLFYLRIVVAPAREMRLKESTIIPYRKPLIYSVRNALVPRLVSNNQMGKLTSKVEA